ncbi:hypothetical protein ABZ883_32695 [Streptomyces sp. NPDC046977]|uniref:hypothetical protein n=1 Tax=Streptomyces sp. NPDC046977 TaxID=3154703 RepID=UPI0033F72405
MKRSRAWAPAAGLVAALALSACGIPPSGVIQAGPAASGIVADAKPAALTDVYFLVDGNPAPYARKVAEPGDLGSVLGLLFDGPTSAEAALATTELPHMIAVPKTAIDDGTASVLLPENFPPFSHAAMLQLTCTVTHATGLQDPGSLASAGGSGGAPDDSFQAQKASAIKNVRALGNGWTRTLPADACPVPVSP